MRCRLLRAGPTASAPRTCAENCSTRPPEMMQTGPSRSSSVSRPAISGCIRDFDGANVSSRSNATKRTCFIHFLICQGAVRLVEILLAPQVDAVHDRGGCPVAHRSGRSKGASTHPDQLCAQDRAVDDVENSESPVRLAALVGGRAGIQDAQ